MRTHRIIIIVEYLVLSGKNYVILISASNTTTKYSCFNLNFIILQGCCLEPQLLEKPLVLAGLVPENNNSISAKSTYVNYRVRNAHGKRESTGHIASIKNKLRV